MTDTRPNTSDFQRLFLEDIPLLDLRAPVEFTKGAFPGSHNAPLMNDEERAKVGTCYKRQGHDAAVTLGHQLVSGDTRDKRTAKWIEFTQQNPEGYLYCFRGGERSHTVQTWLKEEGINYPLITGGYKAMRTWLLEYLEQAIEECRFVILGGTTGTGKTRLLTRFADHIDLEGLANHRGSSFGRRVGGQPTQIDFENKLAIDLLKKRHAGSQTLLLEDESKLIGRCALPLSLKAKMDTAPILLLEESLDTRVQITFEEYIEQNLKDNVARHGEKEGFEIFSEELLASLDRIRKRLGGARHQELRGIMESALHLQHQHQQNPDAVAVHKQWIHSLLDEYYDPMYQYQLEQKHGRIVARGCQEELAEQFLLTNGLASLTPA